MTNKVWHSLPVVHQDAAATAMMVESGTPYAIKLSEISNLSPCPLHWHSVYEISYVVEGTGVFVLEGEEFPFSPGSVHVINSVHHHMAYADDRAILFNVHFPPDLLRLEHFPLFQQRKHRPFGHDLERFILPLSGSDPRTLEVVALLERIRHEHASKHPEWPLVVLGLLLQIAGVLMRHFLDTEPQPPEVLRQHNKRLKLIPALRRLEDLQAGTPSLAELAAELGLSLSHFSALFHEVMGESPIHYRNLRRIEYARQMLMELDAPVSAIAERCGFATMQQFNRLFMRTVGSTPGMFRRLERSRNRKSSGPYLVE